jgi:hypothetical protein
MCGLLVLVEINPEKEPEISIFEKKSQTTSHLCKATLATYVKWAAAVIPVTDKRKKGLATEACKMQHYPLISNMNKYCTGTMTRGRSQWR